MSPAKIEKEILWGRRPSGEPKLVKRRKTSGLPPGVERVSTDATGTQIEYRPEETGFINLCGGTEILPNSNSMASLIAEGYFTVYPHERNKKLLTTWVSISHVLPKRTSS